jgi:hypothetical protein
MYSLRILPVFPITLTEPRKEANSVTIIIVFIRIQAKATTVLSNISWTCYFITRDHLAPSFNAVISAIKYPSNIAVSYVILNNPAAYNV